MITIISRQGVGISVLCPFNLPLRIDIGLQPFKNWRPRLIRHSKGVSYGWSVIHRLFYLAG